MRLDISSEFSILLSPIRMSQRTKGKEQLWLAKSYEGKKKESERERERARKEGRKKKRKELDERIGVTGDRLGELGWERMVDQQGDLAKEFFKDQNNSCLMQVIGIFEI